MNDFKPAMGLSSAHLQTIYPTLFAPRQKHQGVSEIFELDDGDFVECVWYEAYHDSTSPIVVLFHGLGGSVNSPYIQGAMHTLHGGGFAVVVMQFRGCGSLPNRLPRAYHSGDTADAKAWIRALKKRYPNRDIYAVGYSLGGNMLLKLLGEWGDDSLIKAAVSISAPLRLESSAKKINSGFSKLYQFNMMRELKKQLLFKYRYHDMYALLGIDEERVRRLKTFWEFDAVYTAPMHGFLSVDDYYRKSSARQYLSAIQTPTLIIHAKDDPFMSEDVIPSIEELSAVTELELLDHGGHVGFVSGSVLKPSYWLEERIVRYFSTL